MSDRRAAIIRLLETRDDHLPTPTRREHSTPGFVNEESPRSCPDCLSNGRVMKSCEICGGSGVLSGKRLDRIAVPDALPGDGEARDPYAVDKVVPYGLDPTRHDRVRDRDAEIDRLSAQTREPWKSSADELAEANAHPEGWEVARRRMYQAFDYAALDRQLELLRQVDDGAYKALHACFVYRWVEPSAGFDSACERGLRFLDERLPDPLRAPGSEPAVANLKARGWLDDPKALAQRDGVIRARAIAGAKPRELAEEFKLSVASIYIICNGKTA